MTANSVQSIIDIEVTSTGVDQATAALNKLVAAEDKATVASDTTSKVRERNATTLDRYAKQLDAAYKAQAQMEKIERALAQAQAAGLEGTAAYTATMNGLATARKAALEATNDNKEALDDHTRSVGLNKMQMMEGVHVVKSFVDEIVAGQNPIRALALEGGRIAQIFSSGSGGVGGTLRAVGAMIAPIVTNPLTALVAVLGAAALAAYQFSAQQDKLAQSLNGVGRAAGVTVGDLSKIAEAGAKTAGIGQGQGVDLAAQFASSGAIRGDMIQNLIGSTKKFGNAFGLDLTQAGDELAKAFADPTKGAEELNKRLGFLDDNTKQLIKDLQDQGNLAGAQKVLFEAFSGSIKKTTDNTGLLQKAWEELQSAFSAGAHAVENFLAPSLEKQLQQLEAIKATIGAQPTNFIDSFLRGDTTGRLQFVQEQIDTLKKQIEGTKKAASDAADELARMTKSQVAADIVRSTLPEISQRQTLVNQQQNLASAVVDPAILQKMGVSAADAQRALQNLTYQTTNWQSEIEKIAQDSQLASKQSEAWTFAERAAAAEEQARVNILRQTGDQLVAAAKAEEARNAIIAEGNRKAADMLRQANNDFATVGMLPFEKAMKQIEQEFNDFRSQFSTNNAGAGTGAATGAAAAADSIVSYIQQAFAARGIDPSVAVNVAKSEGLKNYTGDSGSSFGPYQLHYGGVAPGGNMVSGLGDVFTQRTGLDARDASTVMKQIDFVADWVKTHGWGDFHGAAKTGISNWQGIGGASGAASASTSTSQVDQINSTSDAVSKQAESVKKAQQAYEFLKKPIVDANISLAAQNALLDVQNATMGQSAGAVAAASKAQEMLNQFAAQGVTEQALVNKYGEQGHQMYADLRASVEATADAYGKFIQRQYDAAEAIKAVQDAQKFLGDSFKSFVETMLSGTGKMSDALKSFGKSFSSNALDALISGTGSLAGISGLAPSSPNGQGGVLKLFGDTIRGATKSGVEDAAKIANDNASQGGLGSILGSISPTSITKGVTAIAGLASAYGAGLSSRSPTMGAITGGISGIVAGASLGSFLGPMGMVAGGVIGAGLGLFGGDQGKKQAQQQQQMQAFQNYVNAIPDINAFRQQASGVPLGSIQTGANTAQQSLDKLTQTAAQAGDWGQVIQLQSDFNKLVARLKSDFIDAWAGIIDELSKGVGASGPFAQAHANILQLGQDLQGFISDTKTAYGDTAPQVEQAAKATQSYALSALQVVDPLTAVRTRFDEINGTASGLQKVLVDLGMSADNAASAIRDGVAKALDQLRATFSQGLQRDINTANGKSYLNDASDLITAYAKNLSDAALIGIDQSQVDQWFKAKAQAIVDSAQLTGTAFDGLLAAFPQLTGVVHSFVQVVDTAAAAAQAATQAAQKSADDAASAVTTARSALQASYDKEAQTLNDTITRMTSFIATIKQLKTSLQFDQALSPLSPQQQFLAAQAQYQDVSKKAIAGDQTAQGQLPDVVKTYLDQAKSYFGFNSTYNQIFNDVQATLDALANSSQGQIDSAQAQLDALNKQVDGLITVNASVLDVVTAIQNLQAALTGQKNANQNFVASLYQSVFGRAADQAGLNYWTGQLNSGAYTTQTLTDALNQAKASGAMRLGGVVGFAGGGIVGNGIYDQDSVLARYAGGGNIALAGGEFVARAPSVNPSTLPVLSHINRFGQPPENDNASLKSELANLKAMLGQLIAVSAAGHSETVGAVRENTLAVQQDTRANDRRAIARK